MAVKTGHSGYPRNKMRQQLGKVKGSSVFFKCDVALDIGTTTFYAGGHMDKKPMYLIATCGTSLEGDVAVRRYRGQVTTGPPTYELPQPNMHATYRRYFNAVDLFNRDCFGPLSVQFAVRTQSWYRRFFLAVLGMCETNALMAYRQEVGEMSRYEWLAKLSEALIENPWVSK